MARRIGRLRHRIIALTGLTLLAIAALLALSIQRARQDALAAARLQVSYLAAPPLHVRVIALHTRARNKTLSLAMKLEMTESDHRKLDNLIDKTLNAYKDGKLTLSEARAALAHVICAGGPCKQYRGSSVAQA